MSECKIEHLEHAVEEIVKTFSVKKDVTREYREKFGQFKKDYDGKRVGYCLEKYINAELDFTTPGNRGLGRMTEYIPRFGAYFRSQLSVMSEEELGKLYGLIQDFMLRGYLVHALFAEEPLGEAAISSSKDLYEKWIPGIYVSNPSEMGNNLKNALAMCSNSAHEKLKSFLVSHNMKGGGFLSKDKTDLILMYYPLAGFGLRFVEIGK